MGRISRSFSARLSSTLLLIVSVLFITAIMVVSYFSHRLIADEATKNAYNILNSTTFDVDKVLGTVESSVTNMRWLVTEHIDDSTYLYHITAGIVRVNEEIVGSAIAFPPDYFKGKHYFSPYSYSSQGDSVCMKQLGNDDYNYFEMEWFKVPYETHQAHWSDPYFDEGGGQMMMTTFSYPIMDEQGEVLAVITADISLDWLTKRINALRPYANSRTILLANNGSYISGNSTKLKFKENILESELAHDNPSIEQLGRKMISGDSGTLRIRNDENDVSFAVYGSLYNGWSAAIISPYKDVFAHLMRMNLIIIIVSALGLFLLFVFCLRIVRKLTQPITEFSVAALNMAKGNFQARLPQIKSHDEMLQLYNSFEYMQQSLTRYIHELRSTTAANERYESELNIARTIQLEMVPTDFPSSDRCSLYATLRPAREVGGDLYDFILVGDELFFSIGDVSGKGVPAALFMAVTRAAFRFLGGIGLSIDQMMGKINDCLTNGNKSTMFVTLFAGKIDLSTGMMTYCNAGHNPLVICHADGQAEFLHAKANFAAGVIEGIDYQLEQIQLEPGARLILYTDGVTEAENIRKEQYGDQRLLDFAATIHATLSSEELVDNLMTDLKKFTGDAEQNDDITVLTISLPEK